MRKLPLFGLLLVCLAVPAAAEGDRTVALNDGSLLVISENQRMRMFDSAGHPLMMEDGKPMKAKDGSVHVMKNDPIWNTLRLKGSLNPKL